WINQETLCTDTLTPSSYPCFSTPGDSARALYKMNMRIFNVSTNHTYDKGIQGLNETWKFWHNSMPDDALATGIYKVGKYNRIPIYNYDGVKIAFLSYTYGTNGIPTPEGTDKRVIYINEEKLIRRQIKLARKRADVVMVSAHWGVEDSHVVTDDQRKLAKKMTSWGADLIIGTHPHVIQNAEWIKAKNGRRSFCMYSLGNFISGQIVADNIIGITFRCYVIVKTNAGGEQVVRIRRPRFYPTVTVYGAGHADEHVVWFRDYTSEQAMQHGIRANDSRFTYDYIWDVLTNTVDKKFLVMPRRKK
nr:CapA family protein [Lachnospiraceae bacterium]